MPAKKIYDCFIFYNELELLKLRLSELYDHVDHFVLCEATVTFQGKPKPLYFDLHKAEFEPFADKIIHVIVDDAEPAKETPQDAQTQDYDPVIWNREHFQRNALRRGLTSAAEDDIIIISDCDEIIRPDTVKYRLFFTRHADVSVFSEHVRAGKRLA
jgi:beta-1,4-mannosyl-glycoprotein beta-1,4-N-acetylglucosaminyltransferase